MSQARRSPILHYLHKLLGAPEPAGVTDADLLRRFVTERDEAAFELLLWRHGTMVHNLCRHVLHDDHAAEDAFQATFLVLLRKAGSIRQREALAGWLYRVAYRLALRARGRGAKRAAHEVEGTDLSSLPAPAGREDAMTRELRQLLYEEVNRLPAKYRAPVVLCYFEARTHEEAAQELAWAKGTVAGRLARAREMLRKRLMRRGLALPAAALSAVLAPSSAPAAGLAVLIPSTIQAAKLFETGNAVAAGVVSTRAAALVEGVLQAMFWTKLKLTAAVLLAVGIVGAGAAGLMRGGFAAGPDDRSQAEKTAEPARQPGDVEKKPVDPAQLARDRGQSRVNLRKLALAMHAYLDAHNQFPMPAIYAKDGKPLLSWRVALLPYLEQENLYKQFHLDESWDSPHNKKLLKGMPKVYAPPGVTTSRPYSTFYQVFVGKRPAGAPPAAAGAPAAGEAPPPANAVPGDIQPPAGGASPAAAGAPAAGAGPGQPAGPHPAFEEHTARNVTQFVDGTSNTILIVEAGKAVPWTKPEDLAYAADRPIPPLGGLFPQVFHAAFADGSVARLWKDFDQQQLRFAITRDGGEVMELDRLKAPFPLPGADLNAARYAAKWAELKKKNAALKHKLDLAAIQAKQLAIQAKRLRTELRTERELLQERAGIVPQPGTDTEADLLKEENKQLQEQLRRAEEVVKQLKKEIQPLQEEAEKQAAEKARK